MNYESFTLLPLNNSVRKIFKILKPQLWFSSGLTLLLCLVCECKIQLGWREGVRLALKLYKLVTLVCIVSKITIHAIILSDTIVAMCIATCIWLSDEIRNNVFLLGASGSVKPTLIRYLPVPTQAGWTLKYIHVREPSMFKHMMWLYHRRNQKPLQQFY